MATMTLVYEYYYAKKCVALPVNFFYRRIYKNIILFDAIIFIK